MNLIVYRMDKDNTINYGNIKLALKRLSSFKKSTSDGLQKCNTWIAALIYVSKKKAKTIISVEC